jgi:hypothetical protein
MVSPIRTAGSTVRGAVLDTPEEIPVIVTGAGDPTPNVASVKPAVVCPCEIVTLAGTAATAVSLLVRLTTTPPDGAAALRVTVPATGWPPRMFDSARPTACNDADGWSVRFAVFETPLQVAVIVVVPPAGRLAPVTVNVPVVWPAAISLLDGAVATPVLLDVSVTVAPEGPAGPVRVRLPVVVPPPGIVDGEIAMVVSAGFDTVRDAVFATPPAVAVSVTVAFASTPSVVTAAVAVFTPARTVTVEGSVAA